MSLPVVESYSAGAFALDGASCVVTKPTGLAAGDLMLASAAAHKDSGTAPTITPPAGWSTYASYTGETFATVYTFYKVADSADAAASNFTFTSNGGADTRIIVGIARISGAGSLTASASGISSNTASPSFSVSLDLVYPDALVLFQIMGRDPSTGTYSAYTTSDTNPTWTEQMDSASIDTTDTIFAVATAGITTPRILTSFGATSNNSFEDHYLLVVVIPGTANATGTPALHTASPTFFAPTPIVGATGTPALHTASPTFLPVTAKATAPTQWVNEEKDSTIWTNDAK